MHYTIKINMIIPKRKSSGGRPLIYPFDTLKVGEYYTCPPDKFRVAISASHNYGKRNGKSYLSRTVAVDNRGKDIKDDNPLKNPNFREWQNRIYRVK